jgi:hypothetical protein
VVIGGGGGGGGGGAEQMTRDKEWGIEDDDVTKKRKFANVHADADGSEKSREKPRSSGLVDFEQWDPDSFNKLAAFYGFRDTLRVEHMFVREDNMASNAGNNKLGSAKFVYYIPPSVRNILEGDMEPNRLKVVTAGMKCLERKVSASGVTDYRIIQEAVHLIAPHVTLRKVALKIQDFCNLLEGGLVSFSTLHHDTVAALTSIVPGALICTYTFSHEDVISADSSHDDSMFDESSMCGASASRGGLNFLAACWRGNSRSINVMCSKADIEFMKHQLTALHVLRPKVKVSDTLTHPSLPVESELEEEEEQAEKSILGGGDDAVIMEQNI